MIPSHTDIKFGNRNLLSDLVEYIYSGTDCKLILIGDTTLITTCSSRCWLRLNEYILEKEFNKQVIVRELTHVVRQDSDSLILKNATNVRDIIFKEIINYPKIKCNGEVKRSKWR